MADSNRAKVRQPSIPTYFYRNSHKEAAGPRFLVVLPFHCLSAADLEPAECPILSKVLWDRRGETSVGKVVSHFTTPSPTQSSQYQFLPVPSISQCLFLVLTGTWKDWFYCAHYKTGKLRPQ
jgi:hypothetical protein